MVFAHQLEQHVSKRGEMHIVNLREFKENVDGVNDERCSKAESINERGKCLIPSFLQDCCIQTMTNADAVASCEPTQCLVSLNGKGYLASEVFYKLKQFFSQSSHSNFQTISKFIPSLVQMAKEVFRQVEENPKLDGMWGLFNEDVQKANEDVKKAIECTEITSLMVIMFDLLGNLCLKNKSLISVEEKDIQDMVNWYEMRSLLELTKNFMKDGEGLKLKKRLEVKGKRLRSIIKREDNGIYLLRDHGNLAFSLIEFTRFHASRIVSFNVLVNEKKLIHSYGVNYDEDQRVFVQSFEIKTTQEKQSVVCHANVHAEGICKTVGALRSEIVSKDIEKIKEDFETENPSIRLLFHGNHDSRMLVHGTSQRKIDEVMDRLRQTFNCSGTGVFQSPKLKLLSVSDNPFFDLIYNYGDEGIYYQGDGLAIVYEEILSESQVKSLLWEEGISDTSSSESSSLVPKRKSPCNHEESQVKSPLCKESLSDIPSSESANLDTEHTSTYKESEVKSLLCEESISDTSSFESSSLVPKRTSVCDHEAEGIGCNSGIVCALKYACHEIAKKGNSQPIMLNYVAIDNRQTTATTTTVNNQQTYNTETRDGTTIVGEQPSINYGESQVDSTLREKSKNKDDSA